MYIPHIKASNVPLNEFLISVEFIKNVFFVITLIKIKFQKFPRQHQIEHQS